MHEQYSTQPKIHGAYHTWYGSFHGAAHVLKPERAQAGTAFTAASVSQAVH